MNRELPSFHGWSLDILRAVPQSSYLAKIKIRDFSGLISRISFHCEPMDNEFDLEFKV